MNYLIIGLGNVGQQYVGTRHNVGFAVLDQLAAVAEVDFTLSRLAWKALVRYRGRNLYLIKPTTLMNRSGKAVAYWLQQLKIPVHNSLVIVDDLALPFGKLRLRPQGSAAGHNGLKDIEQAIKTANYPRLRFGIGAGFAKHQQVDFVLSKFDLAEQEQLDEVVAKAREAVLSYCFRGIDATMNEFNA